MMHGILSTTGSIVKRLKDLSPSIALYADGIKVGNVSLQLRNIRQNVITDLSTLLQLASLCSSMLAANGEEERVCVSCTSSSSQADYTYFSSLHANFALETYSNSIYNLKPAIAAIQNQCGLTFEKTENALTNNQYVQVKDFNDIAQLWCDGKDPTAQYCIENVVQDVINQINRSNGEIAGYFFASLGGVCLLIGSILLIRKALAKSNYCDTQEPGTDAKIPTQESSITTENKVENPNHGEIERISSDPSLFKAYLSGLQAESLQNDNAILSDTNHQISKKV